MPTIGLGTNRAIRLAPALIFVLAIVAIVAFVWIRVALTLTKTVEPARPIGTPSALGWAGRVFTSKAELKRYLAARHIRYAVWTREHPSAIALLEHRRQRASSSTTTAPVAPPTTPAAPRATAASHDASSPVAGIARFLLLLLPWAAFAALVSILAVPPALVWERTGIEITPERRVIVGTVAVVLALGLIVARI